MVGKILYTILTHTFYLFLFFFFFSFLSEQNKREANIMATIDRARYPLKSKIWKLYSECMNGKTVDCKVCGKSLSYNRRRTTNLLRHISIKHKSHYDIHISSSKAKQNNGYNSVETMPDLNEHASGSDDSESELTVLPSSSSSVDPSISKRKESEVWMHFLKLTHDKVECMLCKEKLLYYKGTTTGLRRHLRDKHSLTLGNANPLRVDINDISSEVVTITGSAIKLKSKVWKLYSWCPDGKTVNCKICGKKLVYQNRSTSNLLRHISIKHKAHYNHHIGPLKARPKFYSGGSKAIIEKTANYDSNNDSKDTKPVLGEHYLNSDISERIQTSSSNADPSNTKRKESEVWKHFVKLANGNVQCMICEDELLYNKRTTTGLRRHLIGKHSLQLDDANPLRDDINEIASKVLHASHLWVDKLMRMIILELLPVSIVEKKGFIELMAFANPGYMLPSVNEITQELLPKLYKQTEACLLTKLDYVSHVALTTEMWATDKHENYFSLIVHFISASDWTFQSARLSTIVFMDTPTKTEISTELQRIVADWNILEKVTVMVTDDITNNILADEQLPWAYIPCFGHLIQLVVMEAIAADKEASSLIQKVCDVVNFFEHNSAAYESLTALQRELNLPEHKLVPSSSKRWNSIYYMLERMDEQLYAVNPVLEMNDMNLRFVNEEKEELKQIIACIKPFESAATSLSQDESSCISLVLPLVYGLLKMLRSSFGIKQSLAQHLKDGLTASFGKIEEIEWIVIATLLDPRFKNLKFVSSVDVNKIKRNIVSEMSSLIKLDKPDTSNKCLNAGTSNSDSESFWDYLDGLSDNDGDDHDESKKSMSVAELELKSYIDAAPIPRNDNVLFYWKQHQQALPHVAQIALKYMSVPTTSMPPNKFFTDSCDIFLQKVSQLPAKYVDPILFLNSNIEFV